MCIRCNDYYKLANNYLTCTSGTGISSYYCASSYERSDSSIICVKCFYGNYFTLDDTNNPCNS